MICPRCHENRRERDFPKRTYKGVRLIQTPCYWCRGSSPRGTYPPVQEFLDAKGRSGDGTLPSAVLHLPHGNELGRPTNWLRCADVGDRVLPLRTVVFPREAILRINWAIRAGVPEREAVQRERAGVWQ